MRRRESPRRVRRVTLAPSRAVAAIAAAAVTVPISVAAAVGASSTARPVSVRWLEMTDAVHGYALAGQDPEAYRLLRTSDGGRLWTDITPGGGTIHPSGPFTVAGATVLFSTTPGRGVFAVERSDDGGRSWRRSLLFRDRGEAGQPLIVDGRHLYLAVNEGAAAGSAGEALFTSSDGGHSWRLVSRTHVDTTPPGTLPFGCDKDGFGFSTATRGFAGGYCAGGRPFFYRTDDGGRSWRWQRLPGISLCACDTTAPRFFTSSDGAFSVAGFTEDGGGKPIVRVYWTHDGGAHWRPSASAAVGRVSGVSLTDARTAWVVSTRPGRLRPPFDRLFRTSDGGRTWQALKLPFDGQWYRLDAVTPSLAYASRYFDGASSILRTEDGGRSWQTIHTAAATKP
jgi:photosystem II stability/assembly factor-like uncharacterized protein